MSALEVVDFLASLSAWDWFYILTAWVLVALAAGISLGKGAKAADAAAAPEPDADWLSAWPSGSHLIDFDAVHELLSEPMEQQQVDRVFFDILACEGLS